MTGWLRRIWTVGSRRNIVLTLSPRPNFSYPSSPISLAYQSVCSCSRANQLQYDWIAEKNGRDWSNFSYRNVKIDHVLLVTTELSRLQMGEFIQPLLYSTKNVFCDPVVLESICYCKRANRLINECNTTGELRKN